MSDPSDFVEPYFKSTGKEIGKPDYSPDVREWCGHKVDLGLYWLSELKSKDGEISYRVSHPHGVFYNEGDDVTKFSSWAYQELIKKHVLPTAKF